MDPLIQIAGVKSLEEAEMMVAAGAQWLGFPLRLDVHKPDVSEAEAAKIIRALRPRCRSVLITYLNSSHRIIEFLTFLGTPYVQIHGPIDIEEVKVLRKTKGLFVIKSLVVKGNNLDQLEDNVKKLSPFVDAFITDTFDPTTGASGATGKVHDWQISKRLVEISPRPVILAGGLNAKNVGEAIAMVKPAGVDSHTGVENKAGNKDEVLVKAFIENAKVAFSKTQSLA